MAGLPETSSASGEVLSDAWDYKGRHALNERLTTLGIAVNLVTYLTGTMHLGNAEAANAVTNFMGVSFMLCLLGGFVADTYLGRYLTVGIFTAVQASVSSNTTTPCSFSGYYLLLAHRLMERVPRESRLN
ncbi:hypothetical protein B296_00034802 [Ensete ventricosum]|uniref:Uncharacterized protein n=1 Tax=Ensete ventricosum TaxID=4639 RepID=A0A426Y7M0_ENSVE|nr:hypothetical protein B296_00034802 [Ensete ventricosum]